MAAIPQNFGGGANEGTVGFTTRNNAGGNIGYGASVNLRGLTTSTLTLVEGKRLALGGGGHLRRSLADPDDRDRADRSAH
jgi:hypothetical protein